MKTLLRSHQFLLCSYYVLQILTASMQFFKDVVSTWLSVKGVLYKEEKNPVSSKYRHVLTVLLHLLLIFQCLTPNISQCTKCIKKSYCMVCASVWEIIYSLKSCGLSCRTNTQTIQQLTYVGSCLQYLYTVKPVLSGHPKRRPNIRYQDQLSLNAGQKYCRMLQGEHSAILSTFINLPFAINTFVLPIFEWPLKTGFTVL